jgi:hypothetical protein
MTPSMATNSLQALVMHLDDIPSDEIEDVNILTAIPFFYKFAIELVAPLCQTIMNHPPAPSMVCTLVTIARDVASSTARQMTPCSVTKSMLLNGSNDDEDTEDKAVDMAGHEEEANRNTELYSSIMEKKS